MSPPEASDTQFSRWTEHGTSTDDASEIIRLSAARIRAMEEAGAEIARRLNGPLTALLLYMGEIKQNSQQLAQAAGNRLYLQQVVENALAQTERVCALIKQMADPQEGLAGAPCRKAASQRRIGHAREIRTPGAMFSSEAGQRPLTKREREVLDLISQGFSNKQGALRMHISPRTFESHRAEAMRKLGARNTADLVRLALLHPAV
ncbi:MAG TPA: LuxR C-terminal-related transcriptional regulator [Bradyrhizobium sp.]|jgi:DNA-binding CsgD family transcriptional regulator|uniref:LuxR C-terminal-related transcriptional regulator n=1 Tax=Bradyrhizobium sp. TaxID=376 RepID=UPI002C8FB882|nr:LuxR C-terminal-related transcriptional regulator [Bradyrhizobium sp.]HTB02321.1 LuxR C-terminal-related transcriptional regulator [Bradyrhizobium sp.]